MILEILTLPDKRLRTKAVPVTEFDSALSTLVDNMFETMYDNDGIGLAGTQVNEHKQLFVAHIRSGRYTQGVDQKEYEPLVCINPKITKKIGEREYEEGCLSVPEYTAKVTRADEIELTYQDREGVLHTECFTGLLATCIQHEMDHLKGIVFTDYLSKLKQKRVLERLKKLEN